MFATLRARTRETLVVGDDRSLDRFAGNALRIRLEQARRYSRRGGRARPGRRAISGRRTLPSRCPFRARTTSPMRSRRSPRARPSACRCKEMVAPLAAFRGIGRRFQTIGKARGVEIIDDFAHNADKIAAAIRTARLRSKRVLAVYQPHGYGPTRFLRRDFVTTFARELARARPSVDARSVLCRRHGDARFLRGRHRQPRSPARALTPISRRRASGSSRASPRKRRPAISSW